MFIASFRFSSLPNNICGSLPPQSLCSPKIFSFALAEFFFRPSREPVGRLYLRSLIVKKLFWFSPQSDKDHCLLLALPCGRDPLDVHAQTRALKSGFINYLQQKQAAGIINVAIPGSAQVRISTGTISYWNSSFSVLC